MSGRGGLTLISEAPMDQIRRRTVFRRAHPDAEFTPSPVGGKLLAWVPVGSGGVQFSGTTLENLLDQAEEFFEATEGDGPDTG